jgi:hypothetical protein
VAISGCLELMSFATFFGHLFEAIGDHNKAALLKTRDNKFPRNFHKLIASPRTGLHPQI